MLFKLGKSYDDWPKDQKDAEHYLIQIWNNNYWTKKSKMIYEREITTKTARQKPIANWNVYEGVIVY